MTVFKQVRWCYRYAKSQFGTVFFDVDCWRSGFVITLSLLHKGRIYKYKLQTLLTDLQMFDWRRAYMARVSGAINDLTKLAEERRHEPLPPTWKKKPNRNRPVTWRVMQERSKEIRYESRLLAWKAHKKRHG